MLSVTSWVTVAGVLKGAITLVAVVLSTVSVWMVELSVVVVLAVTEESLGVGSYATPG